MEQSKLKVELVNGIPVVSIEPSPFAKWLMSDECTALLAKHRAEIDKENTCDRCGKVCDEATIVFWDNDYSGAEGKHCQPCYDYLCAYSEYHAELAEEQRAEQAGAEK